MNPTKANSGTAVELNPFAIAQHQLALAANIMGLNLCGVDLLRSNHGPVVMEVNSSPGLEGVETATGVDVAGKIIEFIEKNARPNRTKTRGRG